MRAALIGSASLVAGTAIGAGTLALPQLVGSMGFPAAFCAFAVSWFVVYVMCLFVADLHIFVGGKHSFSRMCGKLGGPRVQFCASLAFLLMGFALLCAYSVGLVDLGGALFAEFPLPIRIGLLLLAFVTICFRIHIIDQLGRYALALAIVVLLGFVVIFWLQEPSMQALTCGVAHHRYVFKALPTIFTSFGCQIVIAPLVDYCRMSQDDIRKVFFWGTLIPLIVYCLWIAAAFVILHKDTALWSDMRNGKDIALAEVMQALANGTGFKSIARWFQGIGFLAVLTSFFGVGVAVVDDAVQRIKKPRLVAGLLLALPVLFVALFAKVVFVRILSIAGAINTFIAVFLPVYIVRKRSIATPLCGSVFGRYGCVVCGSVVLALIVMASEVFLI